MPFGTNADLPRPVRGALPDNAQTIWRNVFNAQDKRGMSEEGSAASAFAAVRHAGFRPPPKSAGPRAKWSKVGKSRHLPTVATEAGRKRPRKKRKASRPEKTGFGLQSKQNRVKNSAMTKSFETTAEVLKVDEELGIVFGWGIVCTEKGEKYFDLQGDHITEEAMLKATSDFMFDLRSAGEMHAKDKNGDAVHAGVIVHSMPLTKELAKAFGIEVKKTGWLIGMKPDADMLEKFKDGTYKGFSIGGERGIDEAVE